ncbi:hypothetical protein F5050DRAFT_1553553, partial [Lentinula boryana]
PFKPVEYYPFPQWFGRFVALPGIEQYGDRFCDEVTQYGENPPSVKCDVKDGTFFHSFPAADGQRFVADRGEEGRWFFLLHADFFNVEGNRLRGKTSSTGVISMTCLNLPLEMRSDPAYTYLPLIIPGTHEPSSTRAHHRHYLRPVMEDLLTGYDRG